MNLIFSLALYYNCAKAHNLLHFRGLPYAFLPSLAASFQFEIVFNFCQSNSVKGKFLY